MESLELLRTAADRTAATAQTARFEVIRSVALRAIRQGDEDLIAEGVTDLEGWRTLTRQRLVPPVILEQARRGQHEGSLLNRLAAGVALQAFKLELSFKWRYYEDGRDRVLERGTWTRGSAMGEKGVSRHDMDPMLPLQYLAAVDAVTGASTAPEEVRGETVTRLDATADLLRVREALPVGAKHAVTRRKYPTRWFVLSAWLDRSGCIRRISFHNAVGRPADRTWWTIELFDFGHPFTAPDLGDARRDQSV